MAGIRTNLGTPRGSYDELMQSGDSEVVIVSAPGGSTGFLAANATGKISSQNLASRIRYEFWDHSGTQAIPTGSYAPIKVNGQRDSVTGGLNVWNTSSFAFQPEGVGSVYTIRFTGIAANPTKNGRIHVDFALSGATPPLYVTDYNRQKQGYEFIVDSQEDHVSMTCLFTVFVDSRLFLSGGQIYTMTDTQGGLTLMSASLFIKEG